MMLLGCCPAGLTKRPMHRRPDLLPVQVRNCHVIDGEEWCEVTIVPVLINDENVKTYIIKVEKEPVWNEHR